MGGYLDVGFKIYPHEIGLALSLVALASLLVFNTPRRTGRPPLDWSVYALAAYLLLHMAMSSGLSLAAGTPGTGTIVRLYMNGLWAVVFGGAFWLFGSLRHLRLALMAATVVCVARVLMAASRLDVPPRVATASAGLFVPPVGEDLRVSALLLLALLVIWFYRSRTPVARLAIGVGVAGSVYLAWAGGSRVAAATAVLVLLFWAAVQRRRAGLIAGAAAVLVAATVFVVVNASEEAYDRLPVGAQRSLSAFVVTRSLEMHAVTEGSNTWHFMLFRSGVRRWTRNPATLMVGNPVEGWDPEYETVTSVEERADIAARLASYESALITMTATLGLVGLLLWARAVYWLYRPFTGRLLRRGIRHPDDALAFVAVQSLFIYLGFAWIAGGYPSMQVVLAALAAAAFRDNRTVARGGG